MTIRKDSILLLFFVSGFAGLIYESVWSHYAKLLLGHAAYAQTLVLVVFIGGLAAGAWLCARMAQRLRNPLRTYAIVEACIGLIALVFHGVFVVALDWSLSSLLPAACDSTGTFCAAQWLLTAALLAPQSILLGATFPLVSSAVLRLSSGYAGHDISTLYFLNSLGAVLGVLASAFILIPAVGLPGTLQTAGWINIAVASIAFLLSRVAPSPLAVERPFAEGSRERADDERIIRLLLVTAFLTGLSSFIYEIVWIRMLSLVLGASTNSFELMLASFILGLALGGYWIRNRLDDIEDPVRYLAWVQLAMGAAAAATIPVYIGSFDLMAWLLSVLAKNTGGFVLFSVSSSLISLMVMLPATFCAGMTLPLITYRLLHSRQGERALGMVYSVNTLGAIAGVILTVHLLMVWLGVRDALLVGAFIDVGLGVFLLTAGVASKGQGILRRAGAASLLALFVLAIAAAAFDIDPRRMSSGVFRTGAARVSPTVNILYQRDGKTATVSVIEKDGVVAIRTNGKPDASMSLGLQQEPIGDEFTMALLALLPLGHNPQARDVAVIGFGSGMTTTALLASPAIRRLDTVEIEPSMIEGARHFRPNVDAAYADPRSHIIIDDAKSYFARGRGRYDIIVSEPSNPWVSGVASLFTEEFYARLGGYLNEGGVLSQWLHTYEMDSQTLASILAAVSKTFPEYVIYSSIDSDIVLIARKGGAPGRFDSQVQRLAKLQPVLGKLKLTDPEAIRRRLVASSSLLTPLFASYQMDPNSDYFPIVEQRTSSTRFTKVRMNDLVELEASAVPMREMLDRTPIPSPRRLDALPVTYADTAAQEAWMVRDAIMGGNRNGRSEPIVEQREMAARLVVQWSESCTEELTFARVLPSLVMVAESTTSQLHPDVAASIWQKLRASRCGRSLAPADARWLQLFEATARRDAGAIASIGPQVLEAMRTDKNPASEFAFFATTTALICRGEAAQARIIMEASSRQWVRPFMRATEYRLLASLLNSPAPPRGACASAAAGQGS